MPSSPPVVSLFFSFPLLLPFPTPISPPCSLSLHDVAFDGGRFCQVMWHGAVVIGSDMAFESGLERSWVVGDVVDVIRPHPSIRGGAADARTIGDGDVATVGDGDVAWLVGIGVGDEHALA